MIRSALSVRENAALAAVSSALGIPSDWLFAAINHESRWRPDIKNPKSSARGLLQWIDSTAKGMGYAGSADLVARNPTIEAQLLGPVLAYLKPYKPIQSLEDLGAVIFYPKYRGRLDDPLPDSVRAANPGIVTLRDYARKYLKGSPVGSTVGVGVALVGVCLLGWFAYKKRL